MNESLFVDPRTLTEHLSWPKEETIRIYDTTLRDGEQTPGVAFSPNQKYQIATALSDIGAHIIDVGFPFVAPSERETLRQIIAGKRRGEIRDDLEILVMCRADKRDVDATLSTLKEVGASPDEITFLTFTSASDLHLQVKLGPTLLKREGEESAGKTGAWYREANIRMMEDICSYIRSQGVTTIELGTEDASRSDLDYLVHLVGRSVEAGATRYIFPDTTGSLTPEATRIYCRGLRKAFPNLPIVSHFHNDFDLAAINTIIALQEGIEGFSVSVNGIGERAGNAALHNVVVALKVLYGVKIPEFKYDQLLALSSLVESLSGLPIRPNEPAVGRNVFAHESGIHTHGMLKDPQTYEPIPHELLGVETRFVYGKHTGFSLLKATLERLRGNLEDEGIVLTDTLIRKTMERLKAKREGMAEDGIAEETIRTYRDLLSKIELSEEDVLEIVRSLA
ncbi:hypothetical protein H8D30_06560 [bacterium]|nr:hypothetical protein [bacterium]